MNTITITKKEYRELYQLREKLDGFLKLILISERRQTIGNTLLKLAKLKIKGGPKDLSTKLDYYLYG